MPTRSVALSLCLAMLALAGCTSSPVSLPDGVELSVFQNRSDYATRTLVIGVANGSPEPITVTRVEFSSPRFDGTAVWDRGTDLRAGGQVDLRVPLPVSVCGVAGAPSIRIIFTTASGLDGAATVTPDDPRDRLDEISREECLVEEVARLATITVGDDVDWAAGAHAPASVSIDVAPTGAAGELTVTAVRQTVLLALVDDNNARVPSLPHAGTVRFVPSRCDPHAVAEDKLGTVFPVEVSVDGTAGTISVGTISVAASDDTRVEIYDYIADFCGY